VSELIDAVIDGQDVRVAPGTTIFEAAQRIGVTIPTVCHLPPQAPAGVCRVCCVEVRIGDRPPERAMAAACARPVEAGMVVTTNSEKIATARRTLVELLLADHQSPCARQRESQDCELESRAIEVGARADRFPTSGAHPPPIPGWTATDDSHTHIAVDHAACIMCDRCVRACNDIAHNDVIGRTGKGFHSAITFDAGRPMGDSTCVSCGECLVSCPTGALMNKGFGDALIPGQPVPASILVGLRGPDGGAPLFEGIAPRFLEKTLGDIGRNDGAVVQRNFAAGEVICTEGDFGSTAFYVMSGAVEVSITAPISRVRNDAGPFARFARKMKSLLTSDADADRDPAPGLTIPIDAPVDLSRARPVATLGAGELFGEMTCLSFYPRSATVKAIEPTVVLEILRPVLQILRRSKAFAAQVDARYRERTLETHLRSIPFLADLPSDFVDRLRERVVLQSFEPGQVICAQGDPSDGFYLVRLGFVKVSQRFPGGELVLNYHGRGGFFGEIGVMSGAPRMATCTAVDHVDVVRIPADEFRLMLDRFADVGEAFRAEADRRDRQNAEHGALTASMDLGEFLDQGLMQAQNLLVLDLDRCTRCDLCVQACATAHDGASRLIREGLRYDNYLVATSCRQCRDPLCMLGCPVGSIRRRDTLEIQIEDWCIGCAVCAENCPYGNITMHEFDVTDSGTHAGRRKAATHVKATACDLCKNLDANQDPSCVVACPHGAAIRVENPREFFASQKTVSRPEHS
jgi:CRP-like cAMP-binding protein/succinate dehydrogenase/fumarate reductase-like Fe-S protein/ferredoxin